ncbi:MAG: hypothetical protein KC940_25330 [Candidatus Omnitrophica bacterium]|nr:hypothetical protein [Candidatus Omnitrophota bacterium]MCA9434550.1 hypothetical protein [Candidatus Omnitrophota bacterium]MCA9444382.1 hypothetical protein [Candidatus Omnitrophota bacterium]MCB9782125.1 hypothetical protein [Candidatus Omnitrophota bacterium]
MKKLWIIFMVGLISCVGAQSATVTVSGGTGLQAAIDGANAGDVIQITDSMTYNEDIFVGPGKDNLTIIGTGVNPPTILATNSTIHSVGSPDVAARGLVGGIMGVVSGLLAGGNPLPDQLGMVIEANNGTYENLILQNNGPSVSPDLFTGACTVIGDDNTFNDCVFRGTDQNTPGVADNEFCISFTSGNWPELDVALGFVSLPNYFQNLGYTTPVAAERTELNNCAFERSTNSVGAGDYSQYFYNAITAGYLNAVVPFNVVFNDCTWTNCGDGEVLETGGIDNLVFNNCSFDGNEGVVDLGGGTWVFNDTVFANSTAGRLFRHDAVVEFGGGASYSTLNGCLFCGNAPGEDRIVEIQEGGATFSRCIFNATEDTLFFWDYNNWDGQFNDAGYPSQTSIVSFDRCDFYSPNAAQAVIRLTGDDTPDAPQPGCSLIVQNCIMTGTDVAVDISGGNLPPGGGDYSIENNDFLAINTIVNNGPGWTEISVADNLSNVAPAYANAGGCSPADYVYMNPALETASTTGGPIGSQDPDIGVITNAVKDWNLYE